MKQKLMVDETQDESIGVEQLPQAELEATPDQDHEPPSESADDSPADDSPADDSPDVDQDAKTPPPFLRD